MSLGADNTLEAVRAVYSGAEGELWELLMGQQIHACRCPLRDTS
jgi:hypothetical protein